MSTESLVAPARADRAVLEPAPRTPALALLLVLGTMFATWLLAGVAVGEATRFVAFEALYVLLPGCLLLLLLSPLHVGWLRVLAIGWPCGFAIQMGVFAVTAALHARLAFTLMPLAALALAAPLLARARGSERLADLRADLRAGDRRLEALLVAVVIAVGLVLLAFAFFPTSPLPAQAHSIFYYPDNVDDISWAAEALHHWPIGLAWVAGVKAHYYTGAFIHFAGVNQTFGVPIATVVLRLFPSLAVAVIGLQLWCLGRAMGRSRWIGPAAVALLLLLEDLNLDPTRPEAFALEAFNVIPLSPTYTLGVILFLGLLALMQLWFADGDAASSRVRLPASLPVPQAGSRVRLPASAAVPQAGSRVRPPDSAAVPQRSSPGLLSLLGLLVLGAGAAKGTAAADFLGGLGLFWLLCLLRRRVTRALSCALAVSTASYLAIYLFMLRGGSAANLRLRPLAFIQFTVFEPAFTHNPSTWSPLAGGSPVRIALLLGAAAVTFLCAFTPILGAGWLLRKPRDLTGFTLLCLAVFALAFAIYLLVWAAGNSVGYFLVFGYIAMVPVAARGLVELLQEIPTGTRRKLVALCASVLVAGLAAAESSRTLSGSGRSAWYVWYGIVYAVIACAVAVAARRLWGDLASMAPARGWRLFACCLPLLLTLGLVKPLTGVAPKIWGTISHERISLADTAEGQGMSASLYSGLLWVRDHTTPCDVLAVNNHYTFAAHGSGAPPGHKVSRYSYYSAFTERRIFLESWYATPRGEEGSLQPYPARLALNDLAVVRGSVSALRALARDGVSYVLVDRTHGAGATEPAGVSRLVFENSALRVYRLLAAKEGGRGCATVSPDTSIG